MRAVRDAIVIGLLVMSSAAVARAMPAQRTITTAGASLLVPSGWHAIVSKTPNCDPERLIVVSSAPLRRDSDGSLAGPRKGQVVILLLEDRLAVDRPSGDLRRPRHFSVSWSRLTHTEPARFCGNPSVRAYLRYFRVRSRYLGFMVYPGTQTGRQVRETTLAVMDSLRVAG
jgi:hypothetical protein